MNALEMHIDTNLKAQKIASNAFRNLDPSELDWLLNNEVDRFIKDRIKKDNDSLGFDATQVDVDALRAIITNDYPLPIYKKSLSDTSVFADLPGDYSFLIDDSSRVVRSCEPAYSVANKFNNTTLYIYAFPLNQSTLTTGPFYVNFILTLNGAAIYTETAGPGLATKEELFTYRDKIMNELYKLSTQDVSYYWEQFGNVYKKNTIIAVATTDQTGSNTISLDGVAHTAVETTQLLLRPTTVGVYKEIGNRLIRGQSRSVVLNSAFGKTRFSSPVSGLDQYSLRVYHDKRFIVNSVVISYIRKPRKISLSLDQSCELAPEFHPLIVDRTVLAIKELTDNPDWQIKLQDMMLNKG